MSLQIKKQPKSLEKLIEESQMKKQALIKIINKVKTNTNQKTQ
ncbi:MAG: hypothetical protein ACPG44_02880 [Polaribacter sp.]